MLESVPHQKLLVLVRAALRRCRLAPLECLTVQVSETLVLASGKETGPDVLDGALHAALLVSACHRHWSRLVAVVRRQFEQCRVKTDRITFSLQNCAFQVIVEQDTRHAAKEFKRGSVTVEEARHPSV